MLLRNLQCDLQCSLQHDLRVLTYALQLQLMQLALEYQYLWCCHECHHQKILMIHSWHDPGKIRHRTHAEIVNITSHFDNEILILIRYHTY